jgi:L-asparaginase / beta-aspartyl-peptidase
VTRRSALTLTLALAGSLALAACARTTTVVSDRGTPPPLPAPPAADGWSLVIHGGAGTIPRGSLTPEREAEFHAALREALLAGHRVLQAGGSSIDAVQAAVVLMEDSPLFNAGRGAVFTAEGRNELDASIMDGRTLDAGAAAGATRVKNPILLARQVMENSPHVMLTGAGADEFAQQRGLELVDPSYFHTQMRWEALQRAQQEEGFQEFRRDTVPDRSALPDDRKFGTVGAVALDRHGNLAAATSTGGMTNKRWGRVGDAPIIGAGTYANNRSCAVSATGHGEFFIRLAVAYDICAQMEYRNLSLADAARDVIHRKLTELGGTGGVVAIDRQGNITMPFNTEGMYRGWIRADGQPHTEIYRD